MARGRRTALVAASALAVAYNLRKPVFVPAPGRRALAAGVPAAAAAVLAAAPALADDIEDASREMSAKAYPYLKEIDWGSYAFLQRPGPGNAADWAKACAKAIHMGSIMDPKLLREGVIAHHNAIPKLQEGKLVCTEGEFEAINTAIGRMIASVPEQVTLDVYDAFSKLVSPEVPAYMMSKVNAKDAKAAYDAWWKFKDVVKEHPITPKPAVENQVFVETFGQIDKASEKLTAASYDYIKEVPWDSDIFQKPIPNASPLQVLKAIDKMLVMGITVDPKILQDAGEAHVKALENMDAKLVATAADYTAINAGIGKMIASVPKSQVMDIYNSMAKLLDPAIPNNMMSLVQANDAIKAYDGFLAFKDVVKLAQDR